MRDAVAEIKSRLNIEDLVSQYVVLKRTGATLKGLCPFHSEKSPSFVVSPDRGIAYCFGCHKGGDVFKFLQEIEGIEFGEALKILAEKTGVELEKQQMAKRITKDERSDLFEIHEEVTAFYEKKLWETNEGAKVLEYLKKRGLSEETIRNFRLGYSPDSYTDTHTMLLKSSFTQKSILLSGLALTKDTGFTNIYDRFRGRLMFPISDSLSRIVGFGGRALKADQEPKYLNSPETPIYQKSQVLYCFSFSKSEIKNKKSVVIVEGYMDALAAFQNGIRNVVAVSGTALTLKQLNLLKPFVEDLILAFDMDNAGQEAAKRSYELAGDFDFNLRVLALPEGKDIAEYALVQGENLPQIMDQTVLVTDYFFNKLISAKKDNSLVEKKKILQEFSLFFDRLKTNLEKDEYVKRLSNELDLREMQVYDELRNYKLTKNHPARSSVNEDPQTVDKKYTMPELILGLLIEFPQFLDKFRAELDKNIFEGELNAIYKAFSDQYNPQSESSQSYFKDLEHDMAERAGLLSLYVSEKYQNINAEEIEKELSALIFRIVSSNLANRKRDLHRKIIQAEQQGDLAGMQSLLNEYKDLSNNSLTSN